MGNPTQNEIEMKSIPIEIQASSSSSTTSTTYSLFTHIQHGLQTMTNTLLSALSWITPGEQSRREMGEAGEEEQMIQSKPIESSPSRVSLLATQDRVSE